MKIRAMIAEDERMARKELVYLLEKEGDIILTPDAQTGDQLLELFFVHRPDVIFLDVEMPGLNGMEAARYILEQAQDHVPLFVFTTAYDEYAIDAFDVEAVDYLLKPYDETRFRRTMGRIRKSLTHREKDIKPAENKEKPTVSKLLIDDGERMVVVSPDSIYYAVPNNRFLEIHTDYKVINSRMTLQDLEEKLKDYHFFRAHRSYLVNLNQILEITPWFNGTSNLTLKDKKRTKIPVSRSASKRIYEIFKKL